MDSRLLDSCWSAEISGFEGIGVERVSMQHVLLPLLISVESEKPILLSIKRKQAMKKIEEEEEGIKV